MLSEEGIKSYFFKRLVPLLNAKINEQLNNFDLPVVINFNENMEESIDEIGSAEKGISYNSFSEGEKKRIDIAILLSFINTMKTISNWNCNLLVFDEILDSATDADGLEKLLGSIKEITLKDSNICSYVVSHRESMQDLYDRIIEIKKVNGFSKVEVKTNG
jgi:DNA repair exonuclease SbcCD ATPase subunit